MIPFDNSYARLPARFYTRQPPTPVRAPALLVLNAPLAAELGLPDTLRGPEGVQILAGNLVPDGAAPLAQVYAGHQFGGFVPRLGDGRAILLGEVIDRNGQRRDIQLKGAGPTPYSRMGDGRAWLGPVLREYLVSEAMHALGIPTTRALAAVATGEDVYRQTRLPGAVLTRVAASHIRVGTFQYFAARNDTEALRLLTDHARQRHFPQAETALDFLKSVIAAQARLVAQWMGVGFIHGVMNTDNMAVSGETIDYGPCAFMDGYHPETVFSSIDAQGRYAYARQADIAVWNLAQLATALLPVLDENRENAVNLGTRALNGFPNLFRQAWLDVFRPKIGLSTDDPADAELIHRLLDLMAAERADFTNTFRALAEGEAPLKNRAAFASWQAEWQARLRRDTPGGVERMRRANPVVIPRNHQMEAAIGAAVRGDMSQFMKFLSSCIQPFASNHFSYEFTKPPAAGETVRQTFCGT
ncbi:uncharacterized protein YdiU (UPF0061 family) [Rhodovulum imhoffii]|uniref:Protein nucleotidyltransferase YdiU n=2 Tax=Rhodovulum imhoffii TaxID=365340 RepID=A0A2T5BTB6_9RHOB|nr:uncharacterized protein YdiU (UPF0061 family) [Rhodovulum imhoffii]